MDTTVVKNDYLIILLDTDTQDASLFLDAMVVDDGVSETVENLDTRAVSDLTSADVTEFIEKYRAQAVERGMGFRVTDDVYALLQAA